ncbi:alpha/beta-hydrolase [Penicillium daleae]|uniref:Alpha/beta-hydrolase n=1 Tax=Penicillium daleae TaxID=63821 RepID=A0AAD6G0F7_9EURO|nr:alpha/beta-hydrolase [Penicillium daleae]KAJ5439647.1 alpha/beta-hydrolase [Penicillium daleae]
MSDQSPTAILIIHGAYFLPSSWQPLINGLSHSQFTIRCPRLPSCGDERPPKATLDDDVAAVRTAAKELINAGHNILVLAHSYGGIVASEAITEELYPNSNRKGIVSLVLLSAWLIQPGDTLEDVIKKYGFQCEVELGNNGDGTVFAKNAPSSFYNDIDPVVAWELAKENVTHNWFAASGKITRAPWKDIPTLYVFCLRDLAIMVPLQRSMVQDAVDAGGDARFVTEEIDSGHCPFVSRPEEVVRVVEKALRGLE